VQLGRISLALLAAGASAATAWAADGAGTTGSAGGAAKPAPEPSGAAVEPARGATGKVVRVRREPGEAVEVPAGSFSMGLDPTGVELLGAACEATTMGITGGAQAQMLVCGGLQDQLHGMAMRTVFVSRFAIGRREVSTAEYRACVAAGGCPLDPLVGGDERYLRDDWPLVNVTWWEAQEYCKWRGGRLPTEAEWERAARGDDTRAWPWGDVARPDDFNHGRPPPLLARASAGWQDLLGDPDDSDDAPYLAPTTAYPWGRGPFGTLNQAGNAAEWVYDAWSQTGYEKLPATNPVREPALFDPRVVRGGSWRQTQTATRVDAREIVSEENLPNTRSAYIGFRCAWDRN
jgi:formylglycine-generating enzyme required for sulfatase activity